MMGKLKERSREEEEGGGIWLGRGIINLPNGIPVRLAINVYTTLSLVIISFTYLYIISIYLNIITKRISSLQSIYYPYTHTSGHRQDLYIYIEVFIKIFRDN